MASTVLSLATSAPKQAFQDDEFIDRLHNRYTVTLLVVFACIVGGQIYVFGSPIVCWCPAEFQSGWVKYTNNYCWVKNTYFLPLADHIPKEHERRNEITYYQWTPFLFLAMAIMYYGPCVFWHAFNSKSGIDADDILASARKYSKCSVKDTKEKQLALITSQMDMFLGSIKKRDQYSVSWRRAVFKKLGISGNVLLLLYLFTKLLYIANTLIQLFMMNKVLKMEYNMYGIQLITDAIMGKSLSEAAYLNNSIFPKVTMCDFLIRRVGNNHRYTVQCLLPINMYTEKIFIFLWFWMVLLLAISVIGLLTWIVRVVLPSDKITYMENHLRSGDRVVRGENLPVIKEFQATYLRQDGMLLLRMIGHNTNAVTVDSIIISIWDFWKENRWSGVRLDLCMYPALPEGSSELINLEDPFRSSRENLLDDRPPARPTAPTVPRRRGPPLPDSNEHTGDGTLTKAELERHYNQED